MLSVYTKKRICNNVVNLCPLAWFIPFPMQRGKLVSWFCQTNRAKIKIPIAGCVSIEMESREVSLEQVRFGCCRCAIGAPDASGSLDPNVEIQVETSFWFEFRLPDNNAREWGSMKYITYVMYSTFQIISWLHIRYINDIDYILDI